MKNEIGFAGNLIKIIEDSRNNALKKVNEEGVAFMQCLFLCSLRADLVDI